jgi:hypothetical protein
LVRRNSTASIPKPYLHEVLTRIADHPINRIDELLPWNLKSTPMQVST